MIIRPEIRDGKIITIEIGYESLPLKKPIPISEFPELYSLLEKLSEYIDFTGNSGWSFQEIDVFLWAELSEKAHDFFKILAQNRDWVKRDFVLRELNISGKVLAGALSSPGQYFSRYKKDPIYEKISRLEDDGKENIYYRLKPEYMQLVRESFEIEDTSIHESEHTDIIFSDDFENEEIELKPSNWETYVNDGKIQISNQNEGAENTSKFVMISSPYGSRDFISRNFEEKERINLTYYLRQEKYGSNGVGAGLHLYYNNKEAIWLCISKKILTYYDNKYNSIIPIELGKWYKINIRADCTTNTFSCIVNDKLIIKNGSFRNKVPLINKIMSTAWDRQDDWSTSFDKIKISIFKEG